MTIDTSAVLAVLLGEPDAKLYGDAIARAWPRRMSVVSMLEAATLVESRGGIVAEHELHVLLEKAAVKLVPVTPDLANGARRAWRRFGKGNHAAALNFGDCFTYALAEATGEPLLFKGEDFSRTDVEMARLPRIESLDHVRLRTHDGVGTQANFGTGVLEDAAHKIPGSRLTLTARCSMYRFV